MIKSLITVPGAELVLPKSYCCYLSWQGRCSLLPISPGLTDIYIEALRRCLGFVTEASGMELMACSRGRGCKDSDKCSKADSTIS